MAAPDDDVRVVTISDTHGPAALDLVGVGLALLGWAPVVWYLVRSRPSRLVGGVAAAVAVASLPALALTLGLDLGWYWIVPCVSLVAAQLLVLLAGNGQEPARRRALRKRRSESGP